MQRPVDNQDGIYTGNSPANAIRGYPGIAT
jgi:hypothetical protein